MGIAPKDPRFMADALQVLVLCVFPSSIGLHEMEAKVWCGQLLCP